jgi:hypothetical protein
LKGLLPLLGDGGWADRLILEHGAPFDVRSSGDVQGAANFAAAVNGKLTKTVSSSA